jgi:hypothetical protein
MPFRRRLQKKLSIKMLLVAFIVGWRKVLIHLRSVKSFTSRTVAHIASDVAMNNAMTVLTFEIIITSQ